jgi:hypothetical protein
MSSSARALSFLVLLLGLTLFASTASATRPTRTDAGCPTSLAPDTNAAAEVAAAAARDVPRLYPQSQYRRFRITTLSSLAPGTFTPAGVSVFRGIAAQRCGARTAARSWVIFLFFPDLAKSASLSQGVAFAVRTRSGWSLWYRFR